MYQLKNSIVKALTILLLEYYWTLSRFYLLARRFNRVQFFCFDQVGFLTFPSTIIVVM